MLRYKTVQPKCADVASLSKVILMYQFSTLGLITISNCCATSRCRWRWKGAPVVMVKSYWNQKTLVLIVSQLERRWNRKQTTELFKIYKLYWSNLLSETIGFLADTARKTWKTKWKPKRLRQERCFVWFYRRLRRCFILKVLPEVHRPGLNNLTSVVSPVLPPAAKLAIIPAETSLMRGTLEHDGVFVLLILIQYHSMKRHF